MVVLITEVLLGRVRKFVRDVEPGGSRAPRWAPAWTLGANLGKDLTRQPGTSTGGRKKINQTAVLITVAFSLFITRIMKLDESLTSLTNRGGRVQSLGGCHK